MKILIALGMLAVAGAASAETITLGPDGCGITVQCVGVPTDTGAVVSLYSYPLWPTASLYIDGVRYIGAQTLAAGYDNAQFQDANGNVVLLTATFGTFRTCVRSGRGQHCSTHYNLLGGSVVR